MIDYKEKYSVCGALESPKDERDYQINQLIAKAVKIPRYIRTDVGQPILDQGDVGCCVAETLVTIKWLFENKQHGTKDEFSPMYIYGNRNLDTDYVGSGLYPREALQHLKNEGVCKKKYYDGLYEYDKAIHSYYENKSELDEHAYPYRISSYYNLKNNIDIMTALATIGWVQICIPVFDSVYSPDKNGFIKYVKGQTNYGGHSVTCIGHDLDKHCFIIQNSWGKDYADNGVFYLDMDYPITEAWAVCDTITEIDLREKYGE